jgi:hypothetical protein
MRGETMRTLIAVSAVTLVVLAAPAVAQTGTGQVCLRGLTGAAQCNFQTMAQCEMAKPAGLSSQCFDRTQLLGTTGSGVGTPAPSGSAMPPSGGATTSPQR